MDNNNPTGQDKVPEISQNQVPQQSDNVNGADPLPAGQSDNTASADPQSYGQPNTQGGYWSYGQQGAYQQPYGQGAYQQPYGQQGGYYPPPAPPAPGKGFAIASMILGIASIVLAFVFNIAGIICAIVGLVMASMAKKRGNSSGMRVAGLVCSIIGLILSGIIFTFMIIGIIIAFSIGGAILSNGIDIFNILGGDPGVSSGGGQSINELNNLLNQLKNLGR